MRVVATLPILLLAGVASAQQLREIQTKEEVRQAGTGVNAMAVGDANGDGHPDLVTGSGGGSSMALYLNNGEDIFEPAPMFTLPFNTSRVTGLLFEDLDGDGDDDIFGVDRSFFLYLNDGDGTSWTDASGSLPTVPNAISAYSVAAGDVDGDGDIDLLMGREGDPSVLLLNDGSAGFTHMLQNTPATTETTLHLVLADLDGDGDLDAVLSNRGQCRVLINDGNGNFTDETATRAPSTFGNHYRVAVDDVDVDGDLDIAFARGGSAGAPNALWLNDGTGQFVALAAPDWPQDRHDTIDVEIADLDGDDTPELIFLNFTGEFQVYSRVRPGAAVTAEAPGLAEGPNDNAYTLEDCPSCSCEEMPCVSLEVWNPDSEQVFMAGRAHDVTTCRIGSDNDGYTVLLGNQTPSMTLQDCTIVSAHQIGPSVASVLSGKDSLDCEVDVLKGTQEQIPGTEDEGKESGWFFDSLGQVRLNGNSELVVSLFDGITGGVRAEIVVPTGLEVGTVTVENDGSMAVSGWDASSGSNVIKVYSIDQVNDQVDLVHTLKHPTSLSSPQQSLFVDDFSDTSTPPVLIVKSLEGFAAWFPDATGGYVVPVTVLDDPSNTTDLKVHDVGSPGQEAPGTGPFSILAVNGDEANFMPQPNKIYRYNGNGGFTSQTVSSRVDISTDAVVVDLNNDGIPDLVIANRNGSVEILLGDENGGFYPAPPSVIDAEIRNARSVLAFDYDGDGDVDLVFFIPGPGPSVRMLVLTNLKSQIRSPYLAVIDRGMKYEFMNHEVGPHAGDRWFFPVFSFAEAAAPLSTPWGFVRLDLAAALFLPPVVVAKDSTGELSFQIPNDPSIVGLDVLAQCLVVADTKNLLSPGNHVSNVLHDIVLPF